MGSDYAAVILSLASDWFIGKSVGCRIGCRPTNRGFSHCLAYVGRQRRSPTLVYAINASGCIPFEIPCRMQDNYISAGVCRCSILDIDRNFARISIRQESARINAFNYVVLPALNPSPGLRAACVGKFKTNN